MSVSPSSKTVSAKMILLLAFFWLLYNGATAQTLNIQKVQGNPCVGATLTFTLMGPGTITHWFVLGSNYTIMSGGGTSNSISVKWNSAQSNVGVTANGPTGNGSSYVSIANSITPAVSITSSATSICKDNNVTFTASPTNGGTAPSYVWYVNGTQVQSGSSKTFSTSTLAAGSRSVYVRMTSNQTGCLTSSIATSNTKTITVISRAPLTATISGPTSVCGDDDAQFSAAVSNYSGSLTYKWKKNGVIVTSYVSGPPAYTLVLNSINDNDVITCEVTSSGCFLPAVSNSITVRKTQDEVFFTGFTVTDYILCKGDPVTFTAGSGTHPVASYQWQMDGGNVIGATGNTFTTVANDVNQLKSIKLITTTSVTSCIAGNTSTATAIGMPLHVIDKPTPPTIVQPICLEYNTNTTLTATGASTNEVYRWYSTPTGGTPLTNLTTPQLTANKTYYATKYNTYSDCETPTRTPFVITVVKKPVVNAGADKTIILPTQEVSLTGSASNIDASGVTYLWSQVSGPSLGTFSHNGSTSTRVFRLEHGVYIFRLTARTNSCDYIGFDEVKVSVSNPPNNYNNYNYIKTTTVLVPGKTTKSQVTPLSVDEKNISTTYFDGLGRPMQQVTWQGSPLKNDLVQPIVYDAYGRESKKYLPFSPNESDGWYKPNNLIIDPATHGYIGIAETFYAPGSDNKIADDERPFSETIFEPSPLNRVIKQGAPGTSWQPDANNTYESNDRTVKFSYESNLANEVLLWNYQYPTTALPLGLVNSGTSSPKYYAVNQLIKTKTKDEEHHEVIEFKDKLGRVILKKVEAPNSEWAETYYIYDDFGNLVTVLPPEAVKAVKKSPGSEYFGKSNTEKNAFLQQWAFRYTYDARKRMVQKQVPGAHPVYMVYDARDRLVLTQDGEQRNDFQWSFTKYDALNRPLVTGIYTHPTSIEREDMDGLISTTQFAEVYNGSTTFHGYSNNVFPTADLEVHTVTYYDNYAFWNEVSGFGNSFLFDQTQLTFKENLQGMHDFPDTENLYVKGQVTGSKVKVLDEGLSEDIWISTVSYYDGKYRPVQSLIKNHEGGIDKISNLYDFAGRVVRTKTAHSIPNKPDITITRDFTYDHAGRLSEVLHTTDGEAPVLLSRKEYNELGELVINKLHSEDNTNFMQAVDFRYNIRGWLTRINNSDLSPDEDDIQDDFFGMELFYNQGFDKPQFNGNISGTRWKNKIDEQERAYGYTYDAMNRITGADYVAGETGNWTKEIDRFEVGNIKYDLNGNIEMLHRNGLFRHTPGEAAEYGITDQLDYKYKGNQLMAVNDAIETPEATQNDFKDKGYKGTLLDPEYDYDSNGNMTRDGNKGITVAYNHLNLPKRVDFTEEKYIEYIYDAAGTKLKQRVHDGDNPVKETDYLGEMVYENGELQFIQHEEGRILPGSVSGSLSSTAWEYQYHLKDHLGNVRFTFTSKPEVEAGIATIEPSNADEELAYFHHVDQVTRINSDLFNHTEGADSHYSIRLSGAEGEKIGLAKSLSVMTGDTIRATVHGKYLDPEQTNYNQLIQNMIATVATGGGVGAGPEPGASVGGDGDFPFGGMLNKTDGNQGVMAYLNYLVFDKNGVLNEDLSGYKALSSAATEDGTGKAHEELSNEIVITEPGLVYIYLSNDSPEPMEVFFDDFEVEHVHSPIVQADDYYPFGLSFNSYKRENSIKNRYLYNDGSERIDDLDLGVDMTKFRVLDPAIGRWWQIDPKADLEVLRSWTPYNYSFNNPIRWNDPLGDCPTCLPYLVGLYQKYSGILSKAQAPLQRSISGNSGNTPSNIGMDNSSRTIAKVGGIGSDIKQISETGKELGREVVMDGANAAQESGDAMQKAGIAVSAVGVPEVGVPLIAVGSVLEGAGTLVETAVNLLEGNYSEVALDGAGFVLDKKASNYIKKVVDQQEISEQGRNILEANKEVIVEGTERILEEKDKENVQ